MSTYFKTHLEFKSWLKKKITKHVSDNSWSTIQSAYHTRLYSKVNILVQFLLSFKGPSRESKSSNVNTFRFLLSKTMTKEKLAST